MAVLRFEFAPGQDVTAPPSWPDGSTLKRAPGRDTFVFFAHPLCACTKASLDELSGILAKHPKVEAYAVFVKLPGFSDEELYGNSWEKAGRIPNLVRVVDDNGAEARRFNAATSGYTLLYDSRGRLAFDGGITPSRGQVGVNEGRLALERLLRGENATRRTRIYGCALFDSSSASPAFPQPGT